MSKSLVIKIGEPTEGPATRVAGLAVEERYQTLGVWFSRDEGAGFDYEWNFQPIFHKMNVMFQKLGALVAIPKGKDCGGQLLGLVAATIYELYHLHSSQGH